MPKANNASLLRRTGANMTVVRFVAAGVVFIILSFECLDSGWQTARGRRESPCFRLIGSSQGANITRNKLLNGSDTLFDLRDYYGENAAQNCYSNTNGVLMDTMPSPVSHENFSKETGQEEALTHDTFINHKEDSITVSRSNPSDSIYQFPILRDPKTPNKTYNKHIFHKDSIKGNRLTVTDHFVKWGFYVCLASKSDPYAQIRLNMFTCLLELALNTLPNGVSGELFPYKNIEEMNGTKLRILVPMRSVFNEFVNVYPDPKGNQTIVTGYSVEVFKEVMNSLPYRVSYDFFPYENGNNESIGCYDELIHQLHTNGYDGVVGDITITADRSKYGDFTQEYMTSGVSMIVPIVDNGMKSTWWFLKPFTWTLWLLILGLLLSTGTLVWFFERGVNPQEFVGTLSKQVWKILSYSFDISFFTQQRKLRSKYSRVVLYQWMVVVIILVTTYSNKLHRMQSSYSNQASVTDIVKLISNGDYIGYQKGSAIFEVLKKMGFKEKKLKAYASKDEYATALSKGSHNNGVAAIIEEIPYINIFLEKYGLQYTMAGPTYRPTGFGFVFRRDFSMLPEINTAVLEFKDGKKKQKLEKKWFGDQKWIPHGFQTPETNKKLTAYDFLGFLLIAETITIGGILISLIISKYREASNTQVDERSSSVHTT